MRSEVPAQLTVRNPLPPSPFPTGPDSKFQPHIPSPSTAAFVSVHLSIGVTECLNSSVETLLD